MRKGGPLRYVGLCVAVVLLALSGCSGQSGQPGQSVEVVAGGGAGGRIEGYVSAVDVVDGRAVLAGEVHEKTATLWWVERDGALHSRQFQRLKSPTDVAVDPDGTVYVLDSSGVWKITDDKPVLLVGEQTAIEQQAGGQGEPRAGRFTQHGSIDAIDVDAHGRLLWTSVVAGDGDEGDASTVVRRLAAGQVQTVRDSLPSSFAHGIATDSSGVYLLGRSQVLRVSATGRLSRVLGVRDASGDQNAPSEPFGEDSAALQFYFSGQAETIATGSDGRLLVVDHAHDQSNDEDGRFTWTGDFSQTQQHLVRRVMAASGAAGPEPYDLGDVALLVHDGRVTTAAAHVGAADVDAGWLYLVGQAGRFRDPGPAEAILVRVRIPR